MKPTDIPLATIWEDQSLTVKARLLGNDEANITQVSLSAITCRVYDLSDDNAVTGTPAVVVAGAVFDVLQSWSKDSVGYNFKFTIPASCFADGDTSYRVEFKFTPLVGDPFYLVHKVTTQNLLQS